MMQRFVSRALCPALVLTAALTAPLLAASPGVSAADSPDPYANETPTQRDARMRWWRDARFGLFIHWGVYSVPAGTYQGKPIGGIGEWIMFNAKIPVAEYRQFARQFNPVQYNADDWVRLAKDAGMKYIIITSKHHDGFALFDSKASDWNVVKATPYGKDLLQPLAEACRQHGLKLGFYYSQAQDWNNPGGGVCGQHWDPAQNGDMGEYIRKVAVPQVTEILSHYGPLGVLWWDTPCGMTREYANALIPLLKLQPGIIHNNRLGEYRGDTETPEQFVPATGYPGRDWETCMTMNDTWGFKRDDQNWKDSATLIRNLVDIASKGGNYLLNVGPTSEGLIPEPSVQRLKEVGRWMRANGESIYATTASPFKRLPWGRCTKKVEGNTTTLYLHVFEWPTDGKLLVPGLKNDATDARLLSRAARKLVTQRRDDGVVVTLPAAAPDPVCSVIAMRLKGAPDVTPLLLTQAADGSIKLPAAEAICHGQQVQYESGHNRDNIGFWTDPGDWVEWQFKVTRPGKFTVSAEIAALGSGSFTLIAGGQALAAKAPVTGDFGKFVPVELGALSLPAAGPVSLSVRPVKAGWQPLNLKSLVLRAAN
jgi:alpha-L-fucosidase